MTYIRYRSREEKWNGIKFCWTGSSGSVESWSATASILGERAAPGDRRESIPEFIRVSRKHLRSAILRTNCAHQQKTTTKSILDPVDPTKVSKTPKQSRKGRRRTSVPHEVSPPVEKTNADFNIAEPESDAAVLVKDGMAVRLRHVRSSRISKPASKRPIGRQKDTTGLSATKDRHRRTGKDPVDVSTLSTEVVDGSINTTMRRSTRGLKRSRSRRQGFR